MPRGKHGFIEAREHKTLPVFVTKVDQEQGIVEAIVSVFGVVDYGSDRVLAGSYRKTLVERAGKIRVLDQHNSDSILRVLGKPLALREVGREELPPDVLLKFPQATGGLWTSTQYLLNTPEGKGAFDRLASGAVDEYSIGYDAVTVGYSEIEVDGKKVRVRDLKEIRLWEYSPVIWGMNPATATTSVKSDDDTTPGNEKEMTPEGPVQRLGDTLHASLLQCSDYMLACLYKEGVITFDQYTIVANVTRAHLAQIHSELPEDLGLLPLSYYFYYSMMGLPMQGVEQKEGRAVSTARAARIQSCIDELHSLLEEAGYGMADDETEEDSGKAATSTAGPSPEVPTGTEGTETPTVGDRKAALEQRSSNLTRRVSILGMNNDA